MERTGDGDGVYFFFMLAILEWVGFNDLVIGRGAIIFDDGEDGTEDEEPSTPIGFGFVICLASRSLIFQFFNFLPALFI